MGADRHATWWRDSPRTGVATGSRPLLVLGADSLGSAVAQACERRSIAYRIYGRAAELDSWALAKVLASFEPWAVVNTACRVSVDQAEGDPAHCRRASEFATTLAAACAAAGARLVAFSSDLVFDGGADEPYTESSEALPLSEYGRGKLIEEALQRLLAPDALVVRTGPVFGGSARFDFLARALFAFETGERFFAAEDVTVSPTHLPDLADATLDLLIDGERGLRHVTNEGTATWAEFVRSAAEAARLRPRSLVALPSAELGWAAPRPRYSVLGSERGHVMPPLEDGLERFVHALGVR